MDKRIHQSKQTTSAASSSSSSSSPVNSPTDGARIVRHRVEWTPTMSWITWDGSTRDPTNTPTVVTPKPVKKKAKGISKQTKLSEFDKDSKSSSTDMSVTVSKNTLRVVDNRILADFMAELHENLIVLMEQIESSYGWFNNHAFVQKDWIIKELPQAISSVRTCPAPVSVMGLNDMRRFLPGIKSKHSFVLIKHLAVCKFYNILIDIDQVGVNVIFSIQHEKDNIGCLVMSYGTDKEVYDDIFMPDE